VGAFDLGDVEEAGGVADEGAAGECTFGYGLEATFVEGSCTVGYALTALYHGFVERVVFHFLEFSIRGEPWIGVIQSDHEAKGNEIVTEVIEPPATICRRR